MSKQLHLDTEARQLVRRLGIKLIQLAKEQEFSLVCGHFELSTYWHSDGDHVWFSYHITQSIVTDQPSSCDDEESTMQIPDRLPA